MNSPTLNIESFNNTKVKKHLFFAIKKTKEL